jgi:predicted negative regulator of RcsB-dependent stress response
VAGDRVGRDWLFLADEATPPMLAAVRAYGGQALGEAPEVDVAGPETVGRGLLQLLFGTGDGGLPDVLAQLVRDPDDKQFMEGLTEHASEAFEADPAAADHAASLISAHFRKRAARGEVQALVDLGHFLYWDDPGGARSAYQEAVDSGDAHALIELGALLYKRLGDKDAALDAFRRAEESGDPDLAAEAIYESAFAHISHRDDAAAAATLQRAIASGHPEWASAAMVGLAGVLRRVGDEESMEAMYQAAIGAANVEWSARASLMLGELLAGRGESEAAKAEWQRVIESGVPDSAGAALMELVNLLSRQDDADGLRAAYMTGAASGNPETLYALTQLGQVLESQGDIAGAHHAWQQAIDAGCEDADYWRERMSPPPPRRRPERPPYPDDLPPDFNPRNMMRTGIQVLEHGLPSLPEVLTYDMAVPVAYWKGERCAVVLVLQFSIHGRDEPSPMAWQVTYTRAEDGSWTPPKRAGGTSFGYDPIASPEGGLYGLDGGAIVHSGGSLAETIRPGRPACTVIGLVAPEVKYLAMIQDGCEDRRLLESHFGAWVICTEQGGSFEVAALDSRGRTLRRLQLP